MRTLALILALTFAVHGQDLVEADGKQWWFLASGDVNGKKVDVYVRRVKGETHPELDIKAGDDLVRAEVDCKAKAYRLKGNDAWIKHPRGTVAERMVKFACKK
jgi:hypothetical protein